MALTPEELALIQEMKAKGASLDQVKAALSKGRVLSVKNGVTAPPVGRYTSETGPVTETLGDIGQTIKGMVGGMWETGQRINENLQAGKEQGFARTALNVSNELIGGVANVAVAQPFLGAMKFVAPESVEKDVAQKFMSVAAPIVGADKVQGWMQGYQWLEQNDPTEFRRVRAELSALQGALDLLGLESTKGATTAVTEGTSQLAGQSLKSGREGIQQLLQRGPQQVPKATGAGAVIQETLENIPRAFEHLAQKADDARARVVARQNAATPEIEQALKVNVPQRQISLLTSMDNQTAKMVDDAMYAYEGGNRGAVSDMYAEVGNALYKPIDDRLKEIGTQIGDAIDRLPNATVDMRPAHQNLISVLRENGIDVTVHPSGRVTYRYAPESPIIESQRKIVEEALNKVFGNQKLSSRGIYMTDQTIGTLNRQLWNSDIIAPRIMVNGQDQLLMTVVRDIFRSPLDNLSPEMRALNREYAQYRGFIDDLDSTLFNTGKELNIKMDPGDAIQNRIARIFSNAQSAKQYERVYDKLYELAVQNKYNGPDLKAFAEIDEYLKRLYPESAIAPRSLPGSIRTSLGDVLEKFINVGTPNTRDQQNAIRALLQKTATQGETPPSATVMPEVTAPQPTKGSQSVSSPNSTTLTPEQESKIVRSLTTERGAMGEPTAEWLIAQAEKKLAKTTDPVKRTELETFIWAKKREVSGEGFTSKKKDITPPEQPPEPPKDLVALHNIHEQNLEKVFGSGGLPAPSIAITKKDLAFDSFGNVTLVGNPKLIDPAKASVKAFSGDVYTVRVPQPEYDIKVPKEAILEARLKDIGTSKEGLSGYNLYDWTKQEFIERVMQKLKYHHYNNVLTVKEIPDGAVEKLNKFADEIYGEPMLFQKTTNPTGDLAELLKNPKIAKMFRESRNFDDFKLNVENTYETYRVFQNMGKRKGFEEEYDMWEVIEPQYVVKVPYTADNIVKSMEERVRRNADNIRATEAGWGTNAGVHVHGFKQFRSLDDIKANKKNIIPKDEVMRLATEREKKLDEFMTKNYSGMEPEYVSSDANYEEIVKKGAYDNIPVIKKQFGIEDDDLAKELGQLIKETYNNVPTQYFEVKVFRTVKLHEFDGAIVPKNTSPDTIKRLEDAGLKVVKYDGTSEDRLKKIATFTGSTFGVAVLVNNDR